MRKPRTLITVPFFRVGVDPGYRAVSQAIVIAAGRPRNPRP